MNGNAMEEFLEGLSSEELCGYFAVNVSYVGESSFAYEDDSDCESR